MRTWEDIIKSNETNEQKAHAYALSEITKNLDTLLQQQGDELSSSLSSIAAIIGGRPLHRKTHCHDFFTMAERQEIVRQEWAKITQL